MHPQSLRRSAGSLLLVAVFATSSSASWFGDWFTSASHEELPTPSPEQSYRPTPTPDPLSTTESVPTLVPPYQSHRWTEEEWPEEGEVVMPDAVPGGLRGGLDSESVVEGWPNAWEEAPPTDDVTLLDPAYPEDFDSAPSCCPAPKIRYWNHPLIGLATAYGESCQRQDVVLELPGECCVARVPVRIPASCVGAPELETRHGLLGRTTHTFCWPCGYRVKVVRWGEGALMVHTYNPPEPLALPSLRLPTCLSPASCDAVASCGGPSCDDTSCCGRKGPVGRLIEL